MVALLVAYFSMAQRANANRYAHQDPVDLLPSHLRTMTRFANAQFLFILDEILREKRKITMAERFPML